MSTHFRNDLNSCEYINCTVKRHTDKVQTLRFIPGNNLSHSKASQPKAPNAPIANTPWG